MPSSSAIATRLTAGSRMKTIVPAGASTSSPSIVNVARPRSDDVHLLVPAGAAAELVVLLDDVLADALARVGVGAERADAELPPQRVPDDASATGIASRSSTWTASQPRGRSSPPQLLEHDRVDALDAVDALLEVLGARPASNASSSVAVVAEPREPLAAAPRRGRRRRRATRRPASCRTALVLRRRGAAARRAARRGRRRAGRRRRRRGRRSRRRARRRAAPPTAGRAGRRLPPGPRRGHRAAGRRAARPRSPRTCRASASTVASETRMLPCAAKHGPGVAAGPVDALGAGVGRAAAARVDDAELAVLAAVVGGGQPLDDLLRRRARCAAGASPSGP